LFASPGDGRVAAAAEEVERLSTEAEYGLFGLGEQDLREALEEELVRAMHAEGDAPTIHAIAHSIARILEQDHLRMAAQLKEAGVPIGGDGR
jgi:hypothetical protein